ncbi:DHH family phosphoesterase, partial [Listeria monocytogenes]|nr:DHH family phosphoesterase [Listeria monocytogenes]
SISQAVYDEFDKIAVIDHHRRGDEFPDKPLLTYIESSASSASELVAELIQYRASRRSQVPKFITTSLLAGIYVDTKNFTVRTTGRTFDIAGYLKNQGADTSLVQYMLSTDLDSYLMISELVSRSQHFREDIVIAAADEDRVYDSVTVAKAADTLLSINGIHAAFVITKQPGDLIGISARSTGKVNVQTLMEALGGGGHFTNAATQIKNSSIGDVENQLRAELTKNEQ